MDGEMIKMQNPLLKIEKLNLSYGGELVTADVNLEVYPGETLAIVGESGCGKTSLLKAIMGIPDMEIITEDGHIFYGGEELTAMSAAGRKKLFGSNIGMVFQNPGAAFNPIRSYRKQFAEMLCSHNKFKGKKSFTEMIEYFNKLGLPDGEHILNSCPYEMSGGMNQRIAIAAAILLMPRLLLLDEPTSALDVSTQKSVLDELQSLKEYADTTIILVTHNLGVAAKIADNTGVMYAGRLIEYGKTSEILHFPLHPYTRSLVASVPKPDGKRSVGLKGQMPLYGAAMPGCAFYMRCPLRVDACKNRKYELAKIKSEHYACCMESEK